MFAIGDKVVYPMHGAGYIEAIETIDDMPYYKLFLPLTQMTIRMMTEKAADAGLRPVREKAAVETVKEILAAKGKSLMGSWNKRYRKALDELKSGDLEKVAEVFRDLTNFDRKGKISSHEVRLLNLARELLQSEIMYILDYTEQEAAIFVRNALDGKAE